MGQYRAAESYFKKALEIYKKKFGEEHVDYAMGLSNLGDLYSEMGDYKAALPFYRESFEIKEKNLAGSFQWLSEKQREAYWVMVSGMVKNLNEFAVVAHDTLPASTQLAYDAALLGKGLLMETNRELSKKIRELKDTAIIDIYNNLRQTRVYLAKLVSESSGKLELMNKLNQEADSLDKLLSAKFAPYNKQKDKLSISWEKVQEALSGDEAAIEFTRYYDYEDSAYRYMALVVRTQDEYPQLVKLCTEDELIAIDPKTQHYRYYPLLWQPMEDLLQDIKTIYYCPAGQLNNISFQAISYKGGKKYLMDRYELHQLTSTRYLATGLKQKENIKVGYSSKEIQGVGQSSTAIALFGGVNYDFIPESKEAGDTAYGLLAYSRGGGSRLKTDKWKYLPGTKEEVDQISHILGAIAGQDEGWIISVHSGNAASEDKLVQYSGDKAPSILHLATHGFAFEHAKTYDSSLTSFSYNKNSMARCGLVMAGGNWAWSGSDTLARLGYENDGVLTAVEISQLELENTKLAVLSACETGLGKIGGTEGTFGLKRGFKLAGVEQLVVSLWEVPDEQTMELMTLFYTELLSTKYVVASFASAQKAMREKYPNDPHLWAGFVLVR
jgi:CHAT domain-containing protein